GGGRVHGLVVSLYFAAAVAMAGMPPLTGFFGKLYVLQAVRTEAGGGLIWAIILITSLVIILGFTRMGSALFWKTAAAPSETPQDADVWTVAPPALAATAAGVPLALLALIVLASGPVANVMTATAAQLQDREAYIAAVLNPPRHADEGLIRGGGAYDDDKDASSDGKEAAKGTADACDDDGHHDGDGEGRD
ncbi:MAG: hypothetical protein AAGB05_17980, partial [Pseudomonadota bacterium]